MNIDLVDRAYDEKSIVKGVHDIIMAGAFNLTDDNADAGFVLMKALEFAEESIGEVLSIAEGEIEQRRNGARPSAEDAGL